MEVNENKVRVHILMYEKDWLELRMLYDGTVGPSTAVRQIVRHYLQELHERAQAKFQPVTVDVSDIDTHQDREAEEF